MAGYLVIAISVSIEQAVDMPQDELPTALFANASDLVMHKDVGMTDPIIGMPVGGVTLVIQVSQPKAHSPIR